MCIWTCSSRMAPQMLLSWLQWLGGASPDWWGDWVRTVKTLLLCSAASSTSSTAGSSSTTDSGRSPRISLATDDRSTNWSEQDGTGTQLIMKVKKLIRRLNIAEVEHNLAKVKKLWFKILKKSLKHKHTQDVQ